MAKGHPDLPRPVAETISKSHLLNNLLKIDECIQSKERILSLENSFRATIGNHVNALPTSQAKFQRFNTNPFVLMIHCLKRQYSRISQIENDILPAKEFSSMETSAGRMIEAITLPVYGWEIVESEMHTANSALDGKRLQEDTLQLVTLKSGPRCLNDEMSENFADAIIANCESWANDNNVTKVDFTYGVLYGTKKISNKKDWHILRNLTDKLPEDYFLSLPKNEWFCKFRINKITINVAVRIGKDWWEYLGGNSCLTELIVALIRACVIPEAEDPLEYEYVMSDLHDIVNTAGVSGNFNVAILQKSQLPWFFFLARHFYDELLNE